MNLGEGSQPQSNSTTKMTADQIHARAETHSEPDVTTQTDSDANKQTYNILLIGETGVGKSTFINTFFFYLTYENLDDALKANDITALIPTTFRVMGDDYKERIIFHGEDENESFAPGASATQTPRSYVFNIGNVIIRLIDTPGIGDTRGMSMDEKNFDQLLATVGELENIHAICIVLKPNNARLTVLFQYCLKELLSRLEKSASQNVVFLFTNSRGTLYRPGDTVVPLQAVLEEIAERPPNVIVPFGKENVFCIDNEAFRFLIYTKHGVYFSDDERDEFAASWKKSSKVCLLLLSYVLKLKPHKIQGTVSINEARRMVLRLSRPLAEIADNIARNLELNEQYKAYLINNEKDIKDLESKLIIPSVDLDLIPLNHPTTVCTHRSCAERIWIDGTERIIYDKVCHDKCKASNVKMQVIGDRGLTRCIAMNGEICKVCHHHFSSHMHTAYRSKKRRITKRNESADANIKIKKDMKQEWEKTLRLLEDDRVTYEHEKAEILDITAKFAHFLANNAITAYNDKYKEYLDFLIQRQNAYGDYAMDKNAIERYKKLLQTYEEKIKILDDTLEQRKRIDSSITTVVTPEHIKDALERLYKLELTGAKVKKFYDAQDKAMKFNLLTGTEKTYTPSEGWITKFINKIPLLQFLCK